MRINLTPYQLAAFLSVAHSGSFSSAALQSGVTQSAISRIIKRIEEELDQSLFDRTTRNVTLTATGRELLPIAERIVTAFDDGLGELSNFITGQYGKITIAALPSVAAVLVPSIVARFKDVAPDVGVTILDCLSGSVLDAVAEGRADLGLTVQPSPRVALTFRPLIRDTLGLVCREDHPLADDDTPLSWSIFVDHPFVAMATQSSVRQITDAAFLQASIAVPKLYGCAFLGTAGYLIYAGLGISALPRLTLPLAGPHDLVWRPLERPAIHRTIGLVTRTGYAPAPATRIFIEILKDEAKKHIC